jgi:hypothetical protein
MSVSNDKNQLAFGAKRKIIIMGTNIIAITLKALLPLVGSFSVTNLSIINSVRFLT